MRGERVTALRPGGSAYLAVLGVSYMPYHGGGFLGPVAVSGAPVEKVAPLARLVDNFVSRPWDCLPALLP